MSLNKKQWELFYKLGKEMEAFLAAIKKHQDRYDNIGVLQRLEEGKDNKELKEGFTGKEALKLIKLYDDSQRYSKKMQVAYKNYLKSVLGNR
jgi:hypothetical protein